MLSKERELLPRPPLNNHACNPQNRALWNLFICVYIQVFNVNFSPGTAYRQLLTCLPLVSTGMLMCVYRLHWVYVYTRAIVPILARIVMSICQLCCIYSAIHSICNTHIRDNILVVPIGLGPRLRLWWHMRLFYKPQWMLSAFLVSCVFVFFNVGMKPFRSPLSLSLSRFLLPSCENVSCLAVMCWGRAKLNSV